MSLRDPVEMPVIVNRTLGFLFTITGIFSSSKLIVVFITGAMLKESGKRETETGREPWTKK